MAGQRATRGVALALLTLGVCGLAWAAPPGQVKAGRYTIYYNALSGDALPLVSARAHGLRHSADQGLVTITANADHAHGDANVPLTVSGHAATLLGQSVPIKIRYVHADGHNHSALVTFTVAGSETVRFDLDVTPQGGKSVHLRFVHSYGP